MSAEAMPDRTYTDDEVREILRRAVGQEAEAGGLGRSELIAAAAEVGIDVAAVDRAILEVESEREIEREVSQLQQDRRKGLGSNFTSFAIVSAGLAGIDWATGSGWWFFWPVGFWAMNLAFKIKGAVFADPKADRESAQRLVDRRRRQRERERETASRAPRARVEPAAISNSTAAVERGVQELLGAARRAATHRVDDELGERAGTPDEPHDGAEQGRRKA